MSPNLDLADGIAVVTLGDTENRFTPSWLDDMNQILDGVERDAGALVTVGSGKFYSNGLDLEWLLANGDQAESYVARVHALFARVLTFPLPTAAAINGHAFGAGAMLAMSHDYRLMREDRGYFCFPEADINIPFTPGMAALIQSRLAPQVAHVSMTTGRRYGGAEARDAGIVDATAADAALVSDATHHLSSLVGKNQATQRAIKATMYATAIEALT